MTQLAGIEAGPAPLGNESQVEDLKLKEYLNRFAPYVDAYVQSNNLDIDAKVDAYRELINDYQLMRSDLDELKTDTNIQTFLGQKKAVEIPVHNSIEDELNYYLTVSGSKDLANFKAEQAALEAEKAIHESEKAYLISRSQTKARIDSRLNLATPIVRGKADKANPETEVKADLRVEIVKPAETESVIEFSEVKLELVDKAITLTTLKDTAQDITARSLNYARENRIKSVAAGAAALSLIGMLATLPTKNSAEEQGRGIANSISGREAFLLKEHGPVAQATITEIVSVENTEKSVEAAQKLREFTNAAKESVVTQPSITVAKPNAKFSVGFLEIFADETAKESVNLGLPIAVQNSVQANAELLKVLAHHPTALKKDALVAIANPENSFQTELTEFLGVEGIIQDPAVYSQEQQDAILGVIARIYDLSNNSKQEAVVIKEAEKNAQDNLKDLQSDQADADVSPKSDGPDLPNNGRLSGEDLQAAEANAAKRAFANRVKDLANQFKNDEWSADRPVKPMDAETLSKIIFDTNARYEHSIFGPKAAMAQLAQESKFDVNAGSHAGAQGIAQFMPGTWPQWSKGGDVNDPIAAIDGQFRFMIALCELMQLRFPDKPDGQILQLALAGYNAGPNNDAVEQGRIPQNGETNVYVDKINKMMARTNEWIKVAVSEVQELNMVVPEGARDLGIHKGYSEGLPVNLHLVGIPNMKSTSDESSKKNKYYVEKSNGEAIVNIRIAAQLLELQKAAQDDGIDLNLVSSYRTHEHQKDLWDANPNRAVVAEPGQSNHQQGMAVDFNLDGLPITASYYKTANKLEVTAENPRVAPESKTWRWLKSNAPKYDFEQYYNEPWHWSPNGR